MSRDKVGPELHKDYQDMLQCMTDAQVEFLVVGAFAVSAWGHVRTTRDIDVFVRPSVDNAQRVMAALKAFGAPMTNVSAGDFETPGVILQIGVEPRRIDIITKIEGVDFLEAALEPKIVNLGGVSVRVIGRDALIKNKRAAGRSKDLDDVKELERLRKK